MFVKVISVLRTQKMVTKYSNTERRSTRFSVIRTSLERERKKRRFCSFLAIVVPTSGRDPAGKSEAIGVSPWTVFCNGCQFVWAAHKLVSKSTVTKFKYTLHNDDINILSYGNISPFFESHLFILLVIAFLFHDIPCK